ncbi:MAG: hypothetical protein Q4A04_07350, partial [Eubacteriales bacterium]|nr:hypothetical protein [Eubacteriales bacterium]
VGAVEDCCFQRFQVACRHEKLRLFDIAHCVSVCGRSVCVISAQRCDSLISNEFYASSVNAHGAPRAPMRTSDFKTLEI